MLRSSLGQVTEDRSKLPPHDTSDRAHLRRLIKKNKVVTVCAIIIALALLAGLGLGIWALIARWQARPNTADFTVVLGDSKPYTVPYEELVLDGVFYIDLRQLATFGGMTVSGSGKKLQFTADDGNYLRFESGSEFAYINGDQVEMTATPLVGGKAVTVKAVITEDKCLVPYDFLLRSVASGMRFRLNKDTNTLTVGLLYYNEDDPEERTPVEILFRSDLFTVIPPTTEPPKYEWFYVLELEPEMEECITKEYLLLANKQKILGEDYKPEDLVELTCETADNRQLYLRADAATALYAMLEEMKASGVSDIYVTSAYRSYDRQHTLFYTTYYNQEKAAHPDWTDEQIYAEILTYSAAPGTSEHQTGLCVDFMTSTMRDLNNSFADTEASAWLLENAHKFGFILRYPEDKVDVTEYRYESWHYRFVGRDAATEMFYDGLCLEEYLEGETAE